MEFGLTAAAISSCGQKFSIPSSDVASHSRERCVKFIPSPTTLHMLSPTCCQQLRGLIPTEGAYSTYGGEDTAVYSPESRYNRVHGIPPFSVLPLFSDVRCGTSSHEQSQAPRAGRHIINVQRSCLPCADSIAQTKNAKHSHITPSRASRSSCPAAFAPSSRSKKQ